MNALTGMGIITAIMTVSLNVGSAAWIISGTIAGLLGWAGIAQEKRERRKQ